MSEKKDEKKWMVLYFPNGKFGGKITVDLYGKNVVTAQEALDIIESSAE